MGTANTLADISSNNASFEAKWYASSGHRVIGIKATEGDNFVNPEYARWVQDAHAHGLSVLHYCFARPEHGDPKGQARHFWQTVHPHFRRPGDYVFWDVETDHPQAAADWLTVADRELRGISGTYPGLYCPLSYYSESDITVASKRIWIAAWGSHRPGNFRWQLPRRGNIFAWQSTNGVVGSPLNFAGIPGRVDGSILNPSVARYFNRLHRKK